MGRALLLRSSGTLRRHGVLGVDRSHIRPASQEGCRIPNGLTTGQGSIAVDGRVGRDRIRRQDAASDAGGDRGAQLVYDPEEVVVVGYATVKKSDVTSSIASIKGKELANIEKALKTRKKDITMTIRVNSEDIEKIKIKAKKLRVKYQSYISEVIHQVAEV